MLIDTDAWIMAFAGGLTLGLAAAIFLLYHGRIAGISGILGNVLSFKISPASLTSIAFLAGLIVTPLVLKALTNGADIEVTAPLGLIIAGGLLVGYGTRLGSGCTSGHGVCGISRLSVRSIVATCIFMAAAIITVSVIRHGLGL